MMKRFWSILLAGALLVTSLAGCGNSAASSTASSQAATSQSQSEADPASDVVLRIYLMKTQWVDAMEKVKEMYLAKNPQIKDIEFEIVHSGNYWDNLKGKLASEDLPDVIQMNAGGVLANWCTYLEPLNDMAVLKELNESSVQSGVIDGNNYIVPMGIEGFGITYNMKLLESVGITEIPQTWTALVTACEKLQAAGIQPFVNHYKETNLTLVKHFSMMPALYTDDANAILNDMLAGKDVNLPGNEYYQKYMDFLELTMKYGNDDSINTDSNTAQNIFFSEQAAMISDEGSWMTPSIKATNPELANYVAQGCIPLTDDVARNKLSIFSTNLSISNTSKNKEEAKKFVTWFVSDPEVLDFMMNEVANMPAAKSVTVDPDVLGLLAEDVKDYMDADRAAVYLGQSIPDQTFSDTGALFQKFLSGLISREDCLTQFNQLWIDAAA